MNSSLFAAVWAKNMSTLRGDGFGQINYDYLVQLPLSKIDRALDIFVKSGFPKYNTTDFYGQLAYNLAMNLTNNATRAAGVRSFLLTLNDSVQIDAFYVMNQTGWRVPDSTSPSSSTHWANLIGNLTYSCSNRDFLLQSLVPITDAAYMADNYFYINSLNTAIAETIFWAF